MKKRAVGAPPAKKATAARKTPAKKAPAKKAARAKAPPSPKAPRSSAVEHSPDKRAVACSTPAVGTNLVKPSSPSVKVFIAAYLRDPNGRRAAIEAGYSERSADSTASRLLKNAKVRAEIDKHHAERIAKVKEDTGITLERTLREIARLAFFDPRKLFDKDGKPLPITDLDDDTVAAIAGLDVLEEFEGSGADRVFVGFVKKWKLADKRGSLDMLMKHLGGYEKDNEQKVDPLVALLQGIGRSALPVVKDAPRG